MSVRVHVTGPDQISVWSGTAAEAQSSLGMVLDEWDDLNTPVFVIEDGGNQEAWVIMGLQVSSVAESVLLLALTGKIAPGGSNE